MKNICFTSLNQAETTTDDPHPYSHPPLFLDYCPRNNEAIFLKTQLSSCLLANVGGSKTLIEDSGSHGPQISVGEPRQKVPRPPLDFLPERHGHASPKQFHGGRMSNRARAFSDPGRFELPWQGSGDAVYVEDTDDTMRICVPLENARYSVSRQSKAGRPSAHHTGSRDILAIPVGHPHTVAWRREANVVSLKVSKSFISEALGGTKLRLPDTFTVRDAFVSAAAVELGKALSAGPSLSPTFAAAIATLIAYRVGTAAVTRMGPTDLVYAPAFTHDQMNRTETFIEEHLGDYISLTMLADQSGLTLWHFRRRFKATLGVSAREYISRRRLARGHSLLTGSNFSILRIATEVGMSHSHFSRSFMNHFGQSPREYRRQQRL